MPYNLYYKGKKLSFNEIIKNHIDLFYGKIDRNLGYRFKPNSKKQILNLLKEKNKKKLANIPKKSLAFLRNNFYIWPN